MVTLPVFAWDGDIATKQVPVPGSAVLERLKLLELEVWNVTVSPFGLFSAIVTVPMLLLVA
jgi:hypothetical protein